MAHYLCRAAAVRRDLQKAAAEWTCHAQVSAHCVLCGRHAREKNRLEVAHNIMCSSSACAEPRIIPVPLQLHLEGLALLQRSLQGLI